MFEICDNFILQNPMELFEKQIKEEDGKLNYDRVNDIIRKYNNTTNEKPNTIEEKHMQQFSSRAIQISKNLYLKVFSLYFI